MLLYRIVMTIANHGNVLALNTFNDNVSQSMLTDGVVELFGYVFSCYASMHFKRRGLFQLIFFVLGVIYVLFVLLGERPSDMDIDTANGITITLLVVGRWAVSVGFGTLWVYTCEVIPTSVRHFAFGVNSSLAYLTLFILSFLIPFLRDNHVSP